MCGKRLLAPLFALVALAVPASASAHPKSATVALDYRLVLDHATRALPDVSVRILDGDRSLRIGVRHGRLIVLGDLGEQMLRIDGTGTWVNEASVTAQAARLTATGSGWRRIGGSTFAWHDHRLAPPPYDGGRTGTVARFVIPATLNGEPVALGGAFVRYRRPSPWPWVAGVALVVVTAVAATRLAPGLRSPLALGARRPRRGRRADGVRHVRRCRRAERASGLGADRARDRPCRRGCRCARSTATVSAGVVLAGLVGAAAAAASLGTLGVFRHGVIVSVLPGVASRSVCALAVAAGVAPPRRSSWDIEGAS